MRCEAVREILGDVWPGEISHPVREHLSECAACAAYARDWRLLRAGFQVLKEESGPEPTIGFGARLLRRLDEAAKPNAAGEFLEEVGRRVVYATSVLAFVLLLALVLPPSGPLRGLTASEILSAEPEVTVAGNDPVFPYELPSELDLVPNNSADTGENREQ
jgi:hypothetical protein